MELQIQESIDKKDYLLAIKLFSAQELKVEEGLLWEPITVGAYFYTSYLACYLIIGDLPSAKYLWKRAPVQYKSTASGSMLCEMWTVGKAMWQNDIYATMIALSVQWPSELVFLAGELRARLLMSQLDTIAQTYTQIPTELLAQKLGISLTETLDSLQKHGWKVDSASGVATPRRDTPQAMDGSLHNDLALLQKVTGYAAHFDRAPIAIEK